VSAAVATAHLYNGSCAITPADASTDRACAGTVAGRLMLWFAFLSVHAFCEPRSTCTRSEVVTCTEGCSRVGLNSVYSELQSVVTQTFSSAVPSVSGDLQATKQTHFGSTDNRC
jgi:hypothetical protein